MRQHAVLLTVLFAFIITIVSVSVVFFEFFKLSKQRYINHIFAKHSAITQIYQHYRNESGVEVMLEANLAVYGFNMESNEAKKEAILKKAKLLKIYEYQEMAIFAKSAKIGRYSKRPIADITVNMLQYKEKIYFFIETQNETLLILDDELLPYKYWPMAYVYLIIIAIISFSFFLILHRLRPLIRLRKLIAKYGSGNMNISFKSSKQDEIALIANEMEAAKERINLMLEARTLFLRNVMHELKTPIAKGTIATQMLESPKQRERFESIFGRLETLVSEFALIEEVSAISDKLEFSSFRLVDIIDAAKDMAMVEDEKVSVEIDASIKVIANYKLYTTAIKNMIDNGIKYSTNNRVTIGINDDGELIFESYGERLSKPLHHYIEPFTKENPSKNSFGLGLYLVDSILKAHHKVLAYEYENGINRFIFA